MANGLARAEAHLDEAVKGYTALLERRTLSGLGVPGAWEPAAVLEKRATAYVNLGRETEALADFERALEGTTGGRPSPPALR